LLRNFEALLHQSFPGRSVVSMQTRRSGELNFMCGGFCAPLSTRAPYWFVFRHPGRSAFHLSSRKFNPGYFGNYPTLVLIRGRTIACDRRETRFLIEYRDAAAFTLGCL
jgi:hypothetical protein